MTHEGTIIEATCVAVSKKRNKKEDGIDQKWCSARTMERTTKQAMQCGQRTNTLRTMGTKITLSSIRKQSSLRLTL
jgi:hypothetical protein